MAWLCWLALWAVLLRDTETLSSSYHSFVVDQDVDVTDPYFSSSGKDYQAKLGGSVTFYCQVENIGTSTLIWKKDNRIISAGPKIIRKDQRFSLSGSNLTMHNIQVKDEGDYVCEVETYTEPIHQENFLTVLIPPSVEPHPKDGKFVVRAGSTITLGCRAEGNPRPVISWRKERSQLPTGKSIVEGNSILIQNVGREDTGRYLCVADNGVGKQASAIISLTVLHPPEIEITKKLRSKNNRLEAEITCNVHAEPRPDIRWYKDTMLLDPSEKQMMQSFGTRHSLLLKDLGITDFGNYSCVAENSLGRDRGFMLLSGKPQRVIMTSDAVSHRANQYMLTWKSVSLLRVQEYRILYRRKGEEGERDTEWTNIIPTMEKRKSRLRYDGVTFKGSFTFYALKKGSQYEVLVQARNEEGWSPKGRKPFVFSTPMDDFETSFGHAMRLKSISWLEILLPASSIIFALFTS